MKNWIQNLPLDKKEHIIVGVIYSAFIPLFAFLFGGIGAFFGFMLGTFFNRLERNLQRFFIKAKAMQSITIL